MLPDQQLLQCGLVWHWTLLPPRKIHAYTCVRDHKHMARKEKRKDLDSRPRKFEQKLPTLLAAGLLRFQQENSSNCAGGTQFLKLDVAKLLTNMMACWFLTRWIVSRSTTATP